MRSAGADNDSGSAALQYFLSAYEGISSEYWTSFEIQNKG